MAAGSYSICPNCTVIDGTKEYTLREDHEFYGAETGVITASYRAHCRMCGFETSFKHRHEIPELAGHPALQDQESEVRLDLLRDELSAEPRR